MELKAYLFRIIICFILSIVIGIERQYRHKVVGLRTNVLVCIGSFMFVSMSFKFNVPDTTRIAAQVVSGIGFLGAGIILKDGSKIKGLNTAATLWCVSAIGVLCSSGMLLEASIGTLFVLLSNIILRTLSQRIMNKIKTQENCTINIICPNSEETNIKNLLIKISNQFNLYIKSFEKNNINNKELNMKINVISDAGFHFDKIIQLITLESNINSINYEHNKLIESDNEDSEDQ